MSQLKHAFPLPSQAGDPQVRPVYPVPKVIWQPAPLSRMRVLGLGLLATAVVFAMAQGVRGAIVSSDKLVGLIRQEAYVTRSHRQAVSENAMLKDQITRYSAPTGIEEMARERLSLVAPGEVLVRLYPTAVAQH